MKSRCNGSSALTPALSRRERGKNARAFTLLELVLVMVLITVTLAIAAPKLTGFSRGSRNRDQAMRVMALCRYARTQAISEGRTYRLNIENDSRYYLTVQDIDQNGQFVPVNGDMGEQFTVQDGTQVILIRTDGGVPDHLDFGSDGRAEMGVIHVKESSGAELEVVSDAPSQQYRILRGDEAPR